MFEKFKIRTSGGQKSVRLDSRFRVPRGSSLLRDTITSRDIRRMESESRFSRPDPEARKSGSPMLLMVEIA
jgi:hypothetical protein